jgi:AraC-like DNA-binding protein
VSVEAALRGGAIALLLLLAAMGLRDARSSVAARYSAFFSISVAAYVVESTPDPAIQHSLWVVPLRLISNGTAAIFWLWTRAHFDDEFVPSWRHWLVWLGLVGLAAAAMAIGRPLSWYAVRAAILLLTGLGLWQALSGRGIDLVESRRLLRVGLAVGTAVYTIVINLSYLAPAWLGPFLPGSVVNAAGLAAMSFAFVFLRLSPPHDEAPAAVAVLTETPAAPRWPAAAAADGQEAAWLAALRQAMEQDKVYREEGFGIASLAARLGLPEYRLRRLINQRLGHRNFTTFVNSYRLAETASALADPSQAAVPILTIALDAGFQSLGPFNRAFKAQLGMTPSE